MTVPPRQDAGKSADGIIVARTTSLAPAARQKAGGLSPVLPRVGIEAFFCVKDADEVPSCCPARKGLNNKQLLEARPQRWLSRIDAAVGLVFNCCCCSAPSSRHCTLRAHILCCFLQGSLEDTDIDEESFEQWYSYYREQFPTVTVAQISEFEVCRKGRGSG